MNDLKSIPAYLMRGGTSKGLIFHKKDLPSDRHLLTEYLLKIMGSPDVRQINGLGGGTSVTSKVCIISKSLEKNIDIDYLSIDIEGGEMNLLKSIDFKTNNIKVISVENNIPKEQNFKNFFEEVNFTYLDRIGQDEIFYNNEYFKF